MSDTGSGKRQIHVCSLEMPTISHNNYGLWAHPDNRKHLYHTIEFWRDCAREAEAALLDAIFIADVLGVADAFGGSMDTSIREGIHIPELDPMLLAAVGMGATERLGWGVTVSASYEPPFGLARRMSTMDHLSDGRIGWNIVMSYHHNADENHGIAPGSLPSFERYERGDDFMEVCYKLWESSWDEDAVLADRENGVYTDPRKVRRIDHAGEYYSCSGPHMVDPSPQRTPVLFQAGMSDRGRRFAAKHAEAVFFVARTLDGLKLSVEDLRRNASAYGRSREEVLAMVQLNVITAPTMAEAEDKVAEFQKWTRPEGYLAHEYGMSNFDPMKHPRERLLDEALALDGLTRQDSGTYGHGPEATIGEIIDAAADIRNEPMFVYGDPVTVADQIESWFEEFDLDGYLLRNYVHPGTVRDFGRYVVPELQRRGRYRTDYEGSTLREHFFGPGRKRLADSHPGARHRA